MNISRKWIMNLKRNQIFRIAFIHKIGKFSFGYVIYQAKFGYDIK